MTLKKPRTWELFKNISKNHTFIHTHTHKKTTENMVEKRSKRKRCKKGTCIALLLVKKWKKIIIDYEYIYRSVPGMQQRHFVYI